MANGLESFLENRNGPIIDTRPGRPRSERATNGPEQITFEYGLYGARKIIQDSTVSPILSLKASRPWQSVHLAGLICCVLL
jgi:hypothetical protein